MTDAAASEVRLVKHSPAYWRVTFDMPPLNIFGPETIPQLDEAVTALETDERRQGRRVRQRRRRILPHPLRLRGAARGLSEIPRRARPGLQALPDMLVRLSRAPVVSIVSIRGRATGVGSELALASDMRFASREKAILSQWEVGAGLVPGGGPMARLPRLIGRGRALEVLLERRRHRRRPRGALRLRQPLVSRCRARRLRRRAGHQDRVLRQAGPRRDEASGRREQPASRRGDRA